MSSKNSSNQIIDIKNIQRIKGFLPPFKPSIQYLQKLSFNSLQKQQVSSLKYCGNWYFETLKYFQIHENDFLVIYCSNLNEKATKQKQFKIESIIREFGQVQIQLIIDYASKLKNIPLLRALNQQLQQLLKKHFDKLSQFKEDSIKFYISSFNPTLKVVIGIQKFEWCVSSKQFWSHKIQNVKNQQVLYSHQQNESMIEKGIAIDGIMNELRQQKLLSSKNIQDCSKILKCFINYARDVFLVSYQVFSDLNTMVLEKKILKNYLFNQQFISIKDVQTAMVMQGTIYSNLYCQHWQGISRSTFLTKKICPTCGQKIVVDKNKIDELNKNNLLMILRQNFLNPTQNDIIYYFKEKIFRLASIPTFSNYPHFCQFYKTKNNLRNRPNVSILLQFQKISLLNKFWGKKRFFKVSELIQTPVRGIYCKHLQFYDLMKVYQLYCSNQQSEEFQCFVCLKTTKYKQILYLRQIELVLELVKSAFYKQGMEIASYLQVNHRQQEVHISSCLQGKQTTKIKLGIYKSLMDPLVKSQQKNINLERTFIPQRYYSFFYGY